MVQNKSFRDIERLYFLTARERADLILVAIGLLPAMRLEMMLGDTTLDAFNLNMVALEYSLKTRNIPYTKQGNSPEDDIYVFVGSSPEAVHQLITAYTMPYGIDRDKKIGHALGYPASAVENYSKGYRQESSQIPDEVKNSKDMRLLDFKLSEDGWKAELEVLHQRAEVLRLRAPLLSKELGIV